jgi:nucleoside-triphosphatase THEP1
MPSTSTLDKLRQEALVKLDSVYKSINPTKYVALRSKLLKASGKKRGPMQISKVMDEITIIGDLRSSVSDTPKKKVTASMISEAKKIKTAPVKVLFKFVVNTLHTTVYSPINEWMSMRFFDWGKTQNMWSEANIIEEKFAAEDNVSGPKLIWKRGDKLVHVVRESVTSEYTAIVSDDDNTPFKMTTRGVECWFWKDRVGDVLRYRGSKPYKYNNFYTIRLPVEHYRSLKSNDFFGSPSNYVKMYLSLDVFLEKVIKIMKAEYDRIEVIEPLNIIKVNSGLEYLGQTAPVNALMRNGVILKDCWLRYAKDISSKAFEETENKCVYNQLAHFLLNPTSGRPTKFIDGQRVSEEALYKFLLKSFPDLKMDEGVSTFMVDLIGREAKRNVYAYDFTDQCFFRSVNSTDRNYCPIIFYRGNGHMYLIDSKEAFKSVVERNKVTETFMSQKTEGVEKQKKEAAVVKHIDDFDGIKCDLGDCDQLEAGVYLLNRYSICDDVIKFIDHYRIIPRVKTQKNSIASMSFLNAMNQEVTIACDSNYGAAGVVYDNLKNIATDNDIDYVNEGIGAVVSRIVCNHKKKRREYLNEQERVNLIESFEHKCAACKLHSDVFEIEYILPLCDGGENDIENMQPLCSQCSTKKSDVETGEYDEDVEQEESSSFNSNVFDNVISTEAFKAWQFVEKTDETCSPDDNVKKIDKIKCRRNLLYYSQFEFPVYSVMDSVLPFHPDDSINVGYYYVETKTAFPFRGCGWYPQPLIEKGLRDKIFLKKDIKLKLESSKKLPKDHFQKNIDKLMEAFSSEPKLQKLCINTYIGLMGKLKYEKCKTQFTLCKYEAANLLCDHNTFIFQHQIGEDNLLYQSKQKQSFVMNSTMYAIYTQILHMEAMHLYETEKMIKSFGGIILDRNTDAIRYKEGREIDITQYYWDDAKTVQKYKWEDPRALMYEVKPKLERQPVEGLVEKFELKWNIEYDYEGDALTKAIEIVDKKLSLHIDGMAGCGKSFLTNKIIEVLKDRDLKFLAFSPTNKGARIIDGHTIDSLYYALKRSNGAINKFKKIDYVIVDEISMMHEKFYSLLISIKKVAPNTVFVITGDFEQLEPVKDSWVGDYKNSGATFELCNGNRLQLIKNRRSDSKLFNLYANKETLQNIKPCDFPVTQDTYLNLAFKHTTRKRINSKCLARFLEEEIDDNDVRLFIPADPKNPKTQDVTLTTGVPVVCHRTRNDKKQKMNSNGFYNSERFEVQRIETDVITLVGQGDREIIIKANEFHKYFYIGFCITIHTSQGDTFKEKYTVYDWGFVFFSDKARYVAISRANSYDNIQISW